MFFGIRKLLLWIRASYPFRWAHHPLCNRFSQDVFRFKFPFLSIIYVCRSCVFFYLGFLLGLIFNLFEGYRNLVPYIFILFCVLFIPLSFPTIYGRLSRPIKDFLRLGLGWTCSLVISFVFIDMWWLSIILVLIFLFLYYIFGKYRQVAKSDQCVGCVELDNESPCSGFKFQVSKVREYEDKSTELFISSGRDPF